MTREALERALANHLPQGTVVSCADMIIGHKVSLRITKSRLSKYGDYRPPGEGKGHRISLNHNLNPYMFLIIFVHEMAHLTTHNKFGNRVDPHGNQWKWEFRTLMEPFIRSGSFPQEIRPAIENYMRDPAASSCVDPLLVKALRQYDEADHYAFLESLPEGCQFKIRGYSNVFIKGKLLRKTYQCQLKDSKKVYRISGIAEVQQVTLF